MLCSASFHSYQLEGRSSRRGGQASRWICQSWWALKHAIPSLLLRCYPSHWKLGKKPCSANYLEESRFLRDNQLRVDVECQGSMSFGSLHRWSIGAQLWTPSLQLWLISPLIGWRRACLELQLLDHWLDGWEFVSSWQWFSHSITSHVLAYLIDRVSVDQAAGSQHVCHSNLPECTISGIGRSYQASVGLLPCICCSLGLFQWGSSQFLWS